MISIAAAGAFILLGAAFFIGQRRTTKRADSLAAALLQSTSTHGATVQFSSFAALPAPVGRYFRHVLSDGQALIDVARMRQVGRLRTSMESKRWHPFTATQLIATAAPGFVWNAKVAMPLATHVRVLDSCCAGTGSGAVSLLSAFVIASASGAPQLNSGALHRYLAEAVWYPTALLPQSGVAWTPINDAAALATLTVQDTTVALEFRFNDSGEVTGIYSPGRFGRFDGAYKLVPWEGHFRHYQVTSGMRIPLQGEVGWITDQGWQAVWTGDLVDVQYEFAA